MWTEDAVAKRDGSGRSSDWLEVEGAWSDGWNPVMKNEYSSKAKKSAGDIIPDNLGLYGQVNKRIRWMPRR